MRNVSFRAFVSFARPFGAYVCLLLSFMQKCANVSACPAVLVQAEMVRSVFSVLLEVLELVLCYSLCSTMHTVRLPRIALDILFLLCIAAAAATVKYGLEPHSRGYACNDESIRCTLMWTRKDSLPADFPIIAQLCRRSSPISLAEGLCAVW